VRALRCLGKVWLRELCHVAVGVHAGRGVFAIIQLPREEWEIETPSTRSRPN